LNKSKKIFLAFAAAFFLVMLIIGYDISKRTTFPGSKKLLIETLMPSDTVTTDTSKMKNGSKEILLDSEKNSQSKTDQEE
jgi:hypothetical protein